MSSSRRAARHLGVRVQGLAACVFLISGLVLGISAPAHAAIAIPCTEELSASTCLDLGGVEGFVAGVGISAATQPSTWPHSTVSTTAQLAFTNASAVAVTADFSRLQYSIDDGESFVGADTDVSNVTIPAGGEVDYAVTLPSDVVTQPTVIKVEGDVVATNTKAVDVVFEANPLQVQPGDSVALTAKVSPTGLEGSVEFNVDGTSVGIADVNDKGLSTFSYTVPEDAVPGASVVDGTFTPTDSNVSVNVSTTSSGFVVNVPSLPGSTTLNAGAVTGLPNGVSLSIASDPTTWTVADGITTAQLNVANVSGADREFDLSALRFSVDNNKTKFAADDDQTDVQVPVGSEVSLSVDLPGDITSGATILATGRAQQLGQVTYSANVSGAVLPGSQVRFTVDVAPVDVTGTVQFDVDGVPVGSAVALLKGHGTITWTVPNSKRGTLALRGALSGGAGIAFVVAQDSFVVAIPPTCQTGTLCIDSSAVAGMPSGLSFAVASDPSAWTFASESTTASITIANAGPYTRHLDLTNTVFSPDAGATTAYFNEDVSDISIAKSASKSFTVTWQGDQRATEKLLITGDVGQILAASLKVTPTTVVAPAKAGGSMSPAKASLQATVYPGDVLGALYFTLDDKRFAGPIGVGVNPGSYSTSWSVPSSLSRTTHRVAAEFVPVDPIHVYPVATVPLNFVVKAASARIVLKAPVKGKAASSKGLVTVTFMASKQASGVKVSDYLLEVLPPKANRWVAIKDGKSTKAVMKIKGLKKGLTYKGRLKTVTNKGVSAPGIPFSFKVK